MSAGLRFLAWARQGLATGHTAPDPLTAPLSVAAGVDAAVRVNELPEAGVRVRLYGPGDVTGIDARQVIRTEPAAGSTGVEPNLFPFVELDRHDLPWLLTPAGPDVQQRLRPWLCLVVVESEHSGVDADPALPRPRLTCRVGELPDLDESWAWAHAQVLTAGDDETVPGVIVTAPERTLARLVCPRRLRPGARYRACLVPAFEPGRKAGLAIPFDPEDHDELRPAWTYQPGSAAPWQLPVYHHWEFTTGAAGDFELLVRRLVPRAMPSTVGTRLMDVRRPGGGLPDLADDAVTTALGLEGALRAPSSLPSGWDRDERETFQRELRRLLTSWTGRVAPPVYGGVHAGAVGPDGTPTLPDGDPPGWLAELNLDPRHRAAAAFGVQVVRDQQEQLMASAWAQAAELARANEALRLGRLAREVSLRLYERSVLPAASTAGRHSVRGTRAASSPGLADDQLLQITSPAHARITVAPPPDAPAAPSAPTVASVVTAEPAVAAAATTAFRRLTRPRGPLARRLADDAADAPQPMPQEPAAAATLSAIADGTVRVTPVLRPPSGTVLLDDLAGQVKYRTITPSLLQKAPAWWSKAAPNLVPSGPLTGDETPSTVLHGPGAALGGNRVWVGAQDGRLFERRRQDGQWRWVDHGRPQIPGSPTLYSVTTAPGGPMPDQRVFVGAYAPGGAARLFQRYWDGDRWAWADHGTPPGTGVGHAPESLAGTTSVWVTGANGALYELRRDGSGWSWVSHGQPSGDWVASAPVCVDADKLFVGGGYGRLYERYRNAAGVWSWVGHGMPGPWTSNTKMEPGAAMLGAKLFVRTGQLGYSLPFGGSIKRGPSVVQRVWNGSAWTWQDHGTPSGAVPAGAPGSPMQSRKMFVTDESGRLWELYWNGSSWVWLDHGMPDGRPIARVAERPLDDLTTFVATRDGHLYERRDTGAGWVWTNHGQPVAVQGGTGAPGDQPAASPRWEPPIGYLSNLVVLHTDAPGGQNRAHLRVGRNLDFSGEVAGSWSAPAPAGPHTGVENQGTGIAVADISGNGKPDLLVLHVTDLPGANTAGYRIGWDLDPNGVPTGGWSDLRPLPEPIADQVQGADVTLADLDGDGRLELVVAYVADGGAGRRIFYRVGWSLDAAGVVSRGWTPSLQVPGDPGIVDGVGVAVADLDGNGMPDLVVLTVENEGGDAGAPNRGVYRIGRRINGRGNVVGGWSGPHQVGGGSFGAHGQGAGLAVADVNGNGLPELIVFHIENLPAENAAYYRIGWDVGASGTTARWSPSHRLPGWWGWENQGAAIAVADIDPGLLSIRTQTGNRFRDAATRHQQHLLAQHDLTPPPAPPADVALAPLADQVREALEPARHVESRVADRVRVPGGSLTDAPGDTLRPLVVAPSFPQPAYEVLREISQDLLLPGVEQVPPETVSLLRGNAAFIEAFMVGLNHEMAREMLWRELPADRRATYFRQFWDARGADPAQGPLQDVPPIARWDHGARLGGNATAVGGPGMLVLLVRGELLRRYPDAVVHLRRARWADDTRTRRDLGDEERHPLFRGTLRPDLTFLGFDLTVSQARGSAQDPGWFFVLAEQPTEPRFGLDEAPEAPSDPGHGSAPGSWADVHWGQMAPDAAAYAHLTHAPASAPFGADALGGLSWGRSAAHLAHITLQRPVQVAVHATDMLGPVTAGRRVTWAGREGDDWGRIEDVGGIDQDGEPWRMTLDEAVAAVQRGEQLFVEEPVGDRVRVVLGRTGGGRLYLRTEADGDEPNNLLALPDSPEDLR